VDLEKVFGVVVGLCLVEAGSKMLGSSSLWRKQEKSPSGIGSKPGMQLNGGF
jgi:hypothetical protein